jgi:hypothetical protein
MLNRFSDYLRVHMLMRMLGLKFKDNINKCDRTELFDRVRSQTAFIKGRALHEGVLALHEIAHEIHSPET